MIKILSLLFAITLAQAPAAKTDADGHTLVKLWQEFASAENADTPKTAAAVLEKIKAEALRQHLAWDYCDACERYVSVRTRSNWKLRDSLLTARRAEIEAFGEPVALYYLNRNLSEQAKLRFIRENEQALRSGTHREFWERDWRIGSYKFSPALLPLLKSDYDYCLWSIFPTEGENRETLLREYASYPLAALAEYQLMASEARDKAKLEAFALKWNGKAAALLAREDILQMRFHELQGDGGSEGFKALRSDCTALISDAGAFKGDEKRLADCCKTASGIIEELDSKAIFFSIEDSKLNLSLRNIGSVNILIYKGKEKVWEFLQANPTGSYYALDELQTALPPLADGSYTVRCVSGKVEQEGTWDKYSISAASRWNADGLGIWAADFRSGKPFGLVDLEILRDSELQRTFKGLSLDAFTSIPKDAENLLLTQDRHSWSLRVRSGDRLSQELAPGRYSAPDLSDRPEDRHCVLLTDRSAFQPEETVHFKAVLYKGKYDLHTIAGQKVTAALRDAENNLVQELELTTNGYGSVAGAFVLHRRNRNGNFRIEILSGGKVLTGKYILVDDFVLPTFDLTFDEQPQRYFPLDSVTLKGTVRAYSGHSLSGADISYSVSRGGEVVASGKIQPIKERFSLSFPVDSSSVQRWGASYFVTVKVTDVTGETMEFSESVYISRHYEVPVPPTEYFFEDIPDKVGVRIVAGSAETWAVAELYGTGNVLIEKRLLHFGMEAPGQANADGSSRAEAAVAWDYAPEWPEGVRLNIIYFQNKKTYTHTLERGRENRSLDLPLSFGRFLDTTAPGAQYTFTIKTGAGAELAATVFDKSTERFMANRWNAVKGQNRPAPGVYFNAVSGQDSGGYSHIFTRSGGKLMLMSKASNAVMDFADADVAEDAAVAALPDSGEAPSSEAGIAIREDFATTVAWEPFLRASADGTVSFSFTNSDKLSTYYVQLFAHDSAMRNATLRREMVVTIPVKISLVEPKFLYSGDVWNVRIGLSSSLAGDVAGTLKVAFLDGPDYRTAREISAVSQRLSVPGGASCNADAAFTAPSGLETLGVKITFSPDRVEQGSDGVFVTVPVRPAVQTLTEAHSAVLLSGMDRSALEASLREAFVNFPGSEASLREISIMDMIREALPGTTKVRGENAIALSSALYAWSLVESLRSATGESVGDRSAKTGLSQNSKSAGAEPVATAFNRDEITSKLLALRCEDGGFAWMKGMSSSPIVTAVVLQRLRGLGVVDEKAAVQYLDKAYFERNGKRWWFCGLSLSQYLYTRSLFPEVAFGQKTTKEFRKEARAYLVPSKERGLNGQVFAKARRLLTLDALSASDEGLRLAKKMGIRLGTVRCLRKSVEADVVSLVQYAEKHPHGGIYYPNAVMPWRGLLESELYAHSMICSLMAAHSHGEIADGIRLWIMLQKETQHWESDPGYIEAIAAVMKASPEVMDTRVLALSGTYTKPFGEIEASGNGMSIAPASSADASVSFPTRSGISVGERIRLTWELSSEENRSFVKVTLPHSAGLVPVNQLSGYRGGCYRNVLPDRTEMWYEAYPEEKLTVSEEYYVTRSGEFQAPAATIECEYAPHYQANTVAPAVQCILSAGE